MLAQYLLAAGKAEESNWNVKGLAIGAFTFITLLCAANTKLSLRISNLFGIVKVTILIFVAITGLVVLGGHTRVADPKANFRDGFAGTSNSANGIANALVKVNFAYSGFENAFSLMNEVKVSGMHPVPQPLAKQIQNPVRTMKRAAPASLLIVFALYMLANVAYFAAIPLEKIRSSGTLTAGLFFGEVFGYGAPVQAMSALVAVSAFGNLVSVIIGTSRIIRECGRYWNPPPSVSSGRP